MDGDVCNGGFTQYHENTGGWPTAFAVDAFREIGSAYYAALKNGEPEWLEVAMTGLVLSHRADFL